MIEFTGMIDNTRMPPQWYVHSIEISSRKLKSDHVPVGAMDFLSTEIEFSIEPCEATSFSAGSGRTVEPDGTKAARSGGWSFPTGGLASTKYDFLYSENE